MANADPANALDDPDVEVRREAVRRLAGLPEPAACAGLLRALGDADWRVRQEAVRAGEQLSERVDLVPALLSAVTQGDDVGLRNAALEVLGQLGERAVPALVEALPSAAGSGRRFLVEALAHAPDRRALDELLSALQSPDPNLVVGAMEALAQLGGDAARAALLASLDRPDEYVRHCALQALQTMGAELPIETLEALFTQRLLRRSVVQALGRSRDLRAPRWLVRVLREGPDKMTGEALAALVEWFERCGDAPTLRDALQSAGTETGAELRERARQGDASAVLLLVLARDVRGLDVVLRTCAERGAVSESLLRAFAAWGEPGIAALLERAQAGSDGVRAVALELACQQLEFVGSTQRSTVGAVLREAIREGGPSVALTALEGLGRWGDASDAQRLAEQCAQAAPERAAAAAQALLELSERHPDAVRGVLEYGRFPEQVQPILFQAWVRLEGEAALARLQAASTHHDPAVRVAALQALVALGAQSAAELIVLGLADESDEVQVEAAHALGELARTVGRQWGADALLLALRDAAPVVQVAAARALGHFRGADVVSALCAVARHGEPLVQLSAIEALRGFDGDAVDDLLVEALGHSDAEVVKQAVQGIAEHPHPRAAARIALALEHGSWDVRQLAAELLGELGEASAAVPLQARLGLEGDADVRRAIEAALARVRRGR